MHTEAVIFDFDGTLVHLNIDFSVMRQGVETFLGEYGIEPDGLKGLLILEMIDEATKLISEKDPLEGQLFYHRAHELVTEHEVRAAKNGRILSGVTMVLKLLKKRGVKVGVITRNCDKAVKIVFPRIEQFCDAFVPRDYVTRVKPHPDHLVLALRKMSVSKSECCLMVGDHPTDIEAGKRVGIKTAGVLTGKATRQEFIEAGADLILDDATKIPGRIFKERAG
ncbi:MAG: HAD family hydrolase [Deltaproteobacteria bacterium]|nr:HAD family hydrolase [Deltaproteobacteria bacterium]